MSTLSVNFSTGDVAERVTVPLLLPPSEGVDLVPAPELTRGFNVRVTAGLSAVDPSKVTSGITRSTRKKRCPSSRSKSADVI